MTCPVCGESFAAKATGRPATFCSTVCRKRADQRRGKAARLLEYAHQLERSNETIHHDPEVQRRRDVTRKNRIDGLRADADELLVGIGPGGPS
jgi:hypothetical protein